MVFIAVWLCPEIQGSLIAHPVCCGIHQVRQNNVGNKEDLEPQSVCYRAIQRRKRRTYYSCNSKAILKAKVLPTMLPKPHKGSHSYGNDGAPKEEEALNRQRLRFVRLVSIHCCCLKVHGKYFVLGRYHHHRELLFVTQGEARGWVREGRSDLPPRGIGETSALMKLGNKPSKNTKDSPPAAPPALSSLTRPTHKEGISSGSLTPVLDVSHVHLGHAAPLAQRQSSGSPKQQARYPIAPRSADRKLHEQQMA